MLAALRWSVRWTLAAVGVALVAGALAVVFIGGSSSLNPSRLNVDTGGRANLVSGGADLFAQRPVWGYGAGSFPAAYREHIATKKAPVSVSHTEPVTVAAEQGVIGLAAYVALIGCALWTMGAGLFGRARAAGRAGGGAGDLRRPPGPHDGLRGLLRGPDHLGPDRDRGLAGGGRGPRARPRLNLVSGYLRRLATTGAAYTAANILSKLIAVALLPLYTRYLTPADYGAAEVLFAAVVAASIVVRFGVIEAVLRFYYKGGEDPQKVVATSFAALFWFATIAALIALPFAKPISEALLDRPATELARIAIGGLWVATLHEYLLTLFRLEERAKAFFGVTLINVLAAIALTVVLVVGRDEGARGLLLGSYISGAVVVLALIFIQRRRLSLWVDRALLRRRAALRAADDAGRALALRAQLRRPDHHRPHRRPP